MATTTPPVPAGWYQDPVGRHQYRWWDGASWTPRVGDGTVEQYDPVGIAPAMAPVGPWAMQTGLPWDGTGGPQRRRPVWPWVVGGVAIVVALGIVGLVVLGIGLETALTHDLLDESFTNGPGVFHEGEGTDFRFAVESGAYVIASTTDEPGSPALSMGELARIAYVVDATARVDWVDGDPLNGAVGLGCFDASGEDGYVFLVTGDGTQGGIVRFRDGAGVMPELDSFSRSTADATPPSDLRLVCELASLGGTAMQITGSVDGQVVSSASDDAGPDGYGYLALAVVAADGQTEVHVDDVHAVVPGE